MTKFELVRANEQHIEQIAAIERLCFSDPWSEKGIRAEINNPNTLFLVAQREDQVAAYGSVRRAADEGYINNIACADEFRRQGAARTVLRGMIVWSQEENLRFLTLEVRVSNLPAITLYRTEGFIDAGVRRNFYSHPSEDALLLTRYLD